MNQHRPCVFHAHYTGIKISFVGFGDVFSQRFQNSAAMSFRDDVAGQCQELVSLVCCIRAVKIGIRPEELFIQRSFYCVSQRRIFGCILFFAENCSYFRHQHAVCVIIVSMDHRMVGVISFARGTPFTERVPVSSKIIDDIRLSRT